MTFEKTLKGKPKGIVVRARAIADQARAGAAAHEIGARRLRHDRSQLSVKIGQRWRLLLVEVDGQLVPKALRSHEDYSRGVKAR